ncbi:MAG: alpha/beta hydrolase [Brachymonas sp.]|nr:alpha/beta hydrolase [Brachymonas sp.]
MNLNPSYLDAQYNNRLRVPNFPEYVQRWQSNSAAARKQTCRLDIAYGDQALQKLDVFPSTSLAKKAPVLIFIHGGYWRSMDKADHHFVAPAFTSEACVVIPNYPLCPAVNMEQLVLSVVQSLVWVYQHIAQFGGDPSRISVVGHSAGGHLAAMMLACQWQKVSPKLPQQLVRNALSLSGLHDLQPIMQSPYLQNDLQLSEQQVRRCSPAYFCAPKGKLIALCGAEESEEFNRQNALIQAAWGKRSVPVCEALPGLNHFSVLEALATPGHRAHDLARSLLQ